MKKTIKREPKKTIYKVPWLPDDKSQLCGEELRKIAEDLKVNDIRNLKAEQVWSIIERDRTHPMRAIYDLDVKKAARAHWVEQTRKIISGIRFVVMRLPDRKVYEPMFINAEAPIKQQGSRALKRGHIFRPDVLASDPIFMSGLGGKIRRMIGALTEAEHLAASRPVPSDVMMMLKDVREAIDRYKAGVVDVAAQ